MRYRGSGVPWSNGRMLHKTGSTARKSKGIGEATPMALRGQFFPGEFGTTTTEELAAPPAVRSAELLWVDL